MNVFITDDLYANHNTELQHNITEAGVKEPTNTNTKDRLTHKPRELQKPFLHLMNC